MPKELPPPPPNCEYFRDDNGCIMFKSAYGYHQNFYARLEDVMYEYYWRGIVCAVARCAWLDEAERLRPKPSDCMRNFSASFEAERNSAAWAELEKEK